MGNMTPCVRIVRGLPIHSGRSSNRTFPYTRRGGGADGGPSRADRNASRDARKAVHSLWTRTSGRPLHYKHCCAPTARYVMRSGFQTHGACALIVTPTPGKPLRGYRARNAVRVHRILDSSACPKICAHAPTSGLGLVPEQCHAFAEFWARGRARKVANLRHILGSIS